MAIRKSLEETLVVDGPREEWLDKCMFALERQGFKNVERSDDLSQAKASYKKVTVWGRIDLTLLPRDSNTTEIKAVVTANVDNLYALFRSPTRRILDAFKAGLRSD